MISDENSIIYEIEIILLVEIKYVSRLEMIPL
jgi:hypothetical protein